MKAFEIPDEDYLAANQWKTQHDSNKQSGKVGSIGGRYTWSFTPSVERVIIQVTCSCGACIDLSREHKW
jgi:hypothetical protein